MRSRSLRRDGLLLVLALTLAACSSSVTPQPIGAGPLPDASLDTGVGPGGQTKQDAGSKHPGMLSCGVDQTACTGQCVSTHSDPKHCGSCGHACGAGQVCDGAGKCALSCPSDLVACGGSCIDPSQDRAHCGASGNCQAASAGVSCNSGQLCSQGSCRVSCGAGLLACGGGCVDPQQDRMHCGASADCSGAHAGSTCPAGSVCSAGLCAVSCQSDLLECGGKCIDPKLDPAHCGASGDCTGSDDAGSSGTTGAACAQGQVCSGGACRPACATGNIACNASCVDPQTSEQYCGATRGCGAGSGSAGAICAQGEHCVSAHCQLVCPVGQLACGGQCVDPGHDNQHCGAQLDCFAANSGTACSAGQLCDGTGHCAPSCSASRVQCGSECVDPQTDPAHCGASGNCTAGNAGKACQAGETCASGVCKVSCPSGQLYCGTQCVDPKTDALHCGATASCSGASAGKLCGSTQVCNGAGQCTSTCSSGFERCGNQCVPTGQCPACGNGGACDPTDLGGASCASLGMGSGSLLCDPQSCTYDTSLCMSGGGGGNGGGGGGGTGM